MYLIRTTVGLGGSPPISRIVSYVASPFTILHAHPMGNTIRNQFNITHWFGKQFPSNCLEHHPDLEFYCDSLQTIPPESPINYNLSIHLPIQQFLSLPFPSHDHSLVVEAASTCFSSNPPTEILTTLVKKDIPPRKFIQDLKSEFGQAILDRQTVELERSPTECVKWIPVTDGNW